MNHSDALIRLAKCRALQPDELTVSVAGDIVDALLGGAHMVCIYCGRDEGTGHSRRCAVTKFDAPERMEAA